MPRMFVVAFAVTAVVFLILDAIWLGVITRNLYQREIGDLLLPKPNFGAAAIFYVIYTVGLVYFCVVPGATGKRRRARRMDGSLIVASS